MPLSTQYKNILKNFQCERTRQIEENFAQILTERSGIRVFFINENECFTDGRNIIIDPAQNELFADKAALVKAEELLGLDNSISSDPWLALKLAARAPNVHESLHIIYSNFPAFDKREKRARGKTRSLVLSLINNIIEDAFIEAAGCSVYDNLEHLLLWRRVALCCASFQAPGSVRQAFENSRQTLARAPEENKNKAEQETEGKKTKAAELIMEYLDYMASWLLYPFLACPEPNLEVRGYVEKTRRLFSDAAVCGVADTRFEYTRRIFDIVEPLIPQEATLEASRLESKLHGMKSHAPESASIGSNSSRGKDAVITRRLFTDADGIPVPRESVKDKMNSEILRFIKEKHAAQTTPEDEARTEIFTGGDFDCSNLHRNIKIEVTNPKIMRTLRKAYQNTVNKYRLSINSHIYRLGHILKGSAEEKEEKKLFGSGISSKYLSDVKKRYWHRNSISISVPDAGFLFLIDGSGSMGGSRQKGAMETSVIIHEILKFHDIQHAIVEHRAVYGEPLVTHTIFVSFNSKADEKYNLLTLAAREGTREGLSLFWAEKYINTESSCEYKIIVIISDGVPAHGCHESIDYTPPISIKDTADAAKKIIRRGTPIIAIAIDDMGQDNCYRQLKQIYPAVVSCTDINKLAGQLLGLVSKTFQKGLV
ncbi:MAG: VWA domain-containing protein [Syntrophomonadaceae bacterium]|jgi:hypothetical protein|nr:VWA domain-containing protein [Syntrophomonadaceae bacterium]